MHNVNQYSRSRLDHVVIDIEGRSRAMWSLTPKVVAGPCGRRSTPNIFIQLNQMEYYDKGSPPVQEFLNMCRYNFKVLGLCHHDWVTETTSRHDAAPSMTSW